MSIGKLLASVLGALVASSSHMVAHAQPVTGEIAKWSGTDWVGAGIYGYLGGTENRLGIGLTSPDRPLSIISNNPYGAIRIEQTTSVGTQASRDAALFINNTGNNYAAFRIYTTNGAQAGPLFSLYASSTEFNQPMLEIRSTSDHGNNPDIRIMSPQPDLTLWDTEETAPAGIFQLESDVDLLSVSGRNAANTAMEAGYWFQRPTSGGCLAIGAKKPAEVTATKLYVSGGMTLLERGLGRLWLNPRWGGTGTFAAMYTENSPSDPLQLRFGAKGDTDQLVLGIGGQVGINRANPTVMFEVNGTAAKPGGGEWSVLSDRRLKHDIRPLRGALQRLLSLRGVTFLYDASLLGDDMFPAGEQIGLVAQEVEQVFPDWIDETDDGYKCVTVRGLAPLVVEALRELRQERDADSQALREELDRLRQDNADLRALVDDLVIRLAPLESPE